MVGQHYNYKFRQILHSALPTPTGLTELPLTVETDLRALSAWFCSNGLKVKPASCENGAYRIWNIGIGQKDRIFSITFDGLQLVCKYLSMQCVKALGVFLERELAMRQQTARVVRHCHGNHITIS